MTLKQLYKTVWEIKQRVLVDMAADRGAFIDQSQSFNVHMSDPNFGKLTSLHFYTWKKGLKTGAGQSCLVAAPQACVVLDACTEGPAAIHHVRTYIPWISVSIAAPPVLAARN